ncbi:MAG: TatD family hydrolase [Clostridia bacterium]|jgi:TatD DNase family protein|nr:TatD family hydrolase [Clostridia bacterium]MDD4275500.1 TatD family hydrolase [Clostridia bacterium]
MIIDTHAHLCEENFYSDSGANGQINYKDIISNMVADGLKNIITVSFDYKSMQNNIEIANNYEKIYCALGVHPELCKNYSNKEQEYILTNAINKKVVAIGEIGLDYHYDNFDKDLQKAVFISQIKLADKVKLPLILHIRDAMTDMIDILKENEQYLNSGFVAHCYSGSIESAKILLDMGGYISFAGPLTFKNARGLIDVVSFVPLDRILTETDSPYLSPEPFRGTLNQPKNTLYVANKIAEIKNLSKETIYENTVKNAESIFKKLSNK